MGEAEHGGQSTISLEGLVALLILCASLEVFLAEKLSHGDRSESRALQASFLSLNNRLCAYRVGLGSLNMV